jgi:DNA mismatch endonuclease (patch repair protein)
VDYSVDGFRGRIDIAFTRLKLAVFVDGCFWHGCPWHGSLPTNNASWWDEKIRGNQRRDALAAAGLDALGWKVLRFWEHVPAEEAALAVVEEVSRASTKLDTP